MKDKKTCDNCTNKYLCPTFNKCGACMGWGEREVFIGLIKLSFGMYLSTEIIDNKFKFIERLQNEER